MLTKTMIALIAVLALGNSFASAATVHKPGARPAVETRVPQTGAEKWQDRGIVEDAGYAYRR